MNIKEGCWELEIAKYIVYRNTIELYVSKIILKTIERRAFVDVS